MYGSLNMVDSKYPFFTSLKGNWEQSNNFCLKYFFIIRENGINQIFQKFTCKPLLVLSFTKMILLTLKWCLIIPKNFITEWNKNFAYGFFSISLTKICKKDSGKSLTSVSFYVQIFILQGGLFSDEWTDNFNLH